MYSHYGAIWWFVCEVIHWNDADVNIHMPTHTDADVNCLACLFSKCLVDDKDVNWCKYRRSDTSVEIIS